MSELNPMSGETLDLTKENIEKLKELFPEVLTEDQIDFEKLRLVLGEEVNDKPEKYSFTWNGKNKAIKLSQQLSTGTLRPNKEKSKNWDTTENLYIEGDNFEVLKLMQKSYTSKIKMIYIDPPYNTGNDFIYKDDYKDNIHNYFEQTSQVDSDGNRLSTNTESSGRFHTHWLNMMYPRLILSKNLLKKDGLIFISINDKELSSLKTLMNEVYGEANYIATLIWDKNHSAQAGIFKTYHEYVLVYSKNRHLIKSANAIEKDIFEAGAQKKESGRHSLSEFTFPKGTRFDAPDGTIIAGKLEGIEGTEVISGRLIARNGKTTEEVTLKAGYTQRNQMEQYFYGDRETLRDTKGQKIIEFYLNSTGKVQIVKQRDVIIPQTTQKFGTQSQASNYLSNLMGTEQSPFDSPKPVNMIKDFILWFTQDDDIILDFFSGSGTTAESVFHSNLNDLGNRSFILVSLPEDLDESYKLVEKDARATVKTAINYLNKLDRPHKLTELAIERIKLAGKRILTSKPEINSKLDAGFKVFKLDTSNIRKWNINSDDIEESLFSMEKNFVEGRSHEDIVYEVLLKIGLDLNTPFEKTVVDGSSVYNVALGNVYVVLGENIAQEVANYIADKQKEYENENPSVVFNDNGFLNDNEKLNSIEILKNNGFNEEQLMSI